MTSKSSFRPPVEEEVSQDIIGHIIGAIFLSNLTEVSEAVKEMTHGPRLPRVIDRISQTIWQRFEGWDRGLGRSEP